MMLEEQEPSESTKHNSPTNSPEEQSKRSEREKSNSEVGKYPLNMRCDCTTTFSLILVFSISSATFLNASSSGATESGRVGTR